MDAAGGLGGLMIMPLILLRHWWDSVIVIEEDALFLERIEIGFDFQEAV